MRLNNLADKYADLRLKDGFWAERVRILRELEEIKQSNEDLLESF